jgi:hypothetical protein
VPPISLAPVPLSTRYAGGPALSLLPLKHIGAPEPAPSAPPDPFVGYDFGPGVRTLSYRATFLANQAMEGADGNLYATYYWPPAGPMAYDPDKFGIVTGGAIREIISARFLDMVSITGRSGGYPTFSIGEGTTPTGTEFHGTWRLEASGPHLLSSGEPPLVTCELCDWPGSVSTSRKGRCVDFAAGDLCEHDQRVTYSRNKQLLVTIRGAHIVGAGPHRFLISAFDANHVGVWNLEGFAH